VDITLPSGRAGPSNFFAPPIKGQPTHKQAEWKPGCEAPTTCKRREERHTAEPGCMPLRRCPRRLPTPIRHDRPLLWTPLMPVRKRVNLLNTRTLCFGSNPRSNTYNRSQSSHTPQTLFRCRRTHHSTPRPLADHPQPSPQYSVYSSSASASPLSSASPFVSPYSPV
jgi:hypothetical protein